MITFLYDKDNHLITDLVNSAILNPDIIKIRNRLLDGTYHVQSIGDRIDSINIICYVDQTNKDRLDNIYIKDEPIKLVKEGKHYIGLIENKDEWTKFSKRLYETQFTLVVSEEGLA